MLTNVAAPYAKTGGLADVLGSLPRALARLGHHVDVVIPRYRGITAGEFTASLVAVPGSNPDGTGMQWDEAVLFLLAA